ncbi:MAG: hypothetical protein GF383_03795 [Candidatus Lokiarchaeota archaeon]|nr:hypothetical protein [Candidatus Lokiarchaeota archaeon]MBD3338823.1 hypothetical protein [Candidatus Lokiarchaeota archaeon]
MVDEYHKFVVEINGEEYEFSLEAHDGDYYLSIDDLGGLADMVPLHREQYDWIKPQIDKIRGVKQTWITRWHIQTESALKKVKRILLKSGYLAF